MQVLPPHQAEQTTFVPPPTAAATQLVAQLLQQQAASEAAAAAAAAADPEASDVDATSDFDDSPSIPESMSIPETYRQHTFCNGRRYHKYRRGAYPIPNDELEQEREELLHLMMLEATEGRHFFAPIGEYPQKILDLGTGTGAWPIEVADQYPSAEVLGVDLSPIQPCWIPPNCKFLMDDIEDTWENGPDWDFVHMRNVLPILKNPAGLLKNIYDNLRPGGFIELQGIDGNVHCDDGTMPSDWVVLTFLNLVMEAFSRFGTETRVMERAGELLIDCGFVNVRQVEIKLPYGAWSDNSKDRVVGDLFRMSSEQFFPAMAAVHLPLLGMTPEQCEKLFDQCEAGMKDPNIHSYGKMHFWYGQKPYDR